MLNASDAASRAASGTPAFDRGSFRDPAGRVFERDARIFRTVSPLVAEDFGWITSSGLLDELAATGRCVRTWEADARAAGAGDAWKVLESERIPFISYPYEWPFGALKRAALFHLDLHLELLGRGGTLIDASAYNVQFRGPHPVFIDVLSLRRYREGEIWAGHRQFCEQFLNPLLLGALVGVPHNAWYRGTLDGISMQQLAPMLKPRHKLSWNVLAHVVLPERLQRMSSAGFMGASAAGNAPRKLPKRALVSMLTGLRRFIARLEPADRRGTVWTGYAGDNTYSDAEREQKRNAVRDFVATNGIQRVLDLGCNTGDYAEAALRAGAKSVIGIESDAATADLAFTRALAQDLDFLPLIVDAANPSPAQGWRGAERRGFTERAAVDAVIALAFEHHLAIGRNIPLEQLVGWLAGLAPRGIVEFVPKDDPTVQRMLALREDIFGDYSEDNFAALLRRSARVTKQERITATGRTLFRFERA